MKKIYTLILAMAVTFVSCDTEEVSEIEESVEAISHGYRYKRKAKKIRECVVVDSDKCPFEDRWPVANFWWPENDTDKYFIPRAYFSTDDQNSLTFTEYDNGTANIKGSTVMGSCVVQVDVWLKGKKNWEEWSAIGGEHKKEGCAGNESDSTLMDYYVINSKRSRIWAVGGDCLEEGKFGVKQRPDPYDSSTPHYGAHVGPGGANYDSEIGAEGLSTWGWLTDCNTGERKWIFDFNFKLECKDVEYKCKRRRCKGRKYWHKGKYKKCLHYHNRRWGWSRWKK